MCGVFRLPETDEMLLRLERIYAGTGLMRQCVMQGDAHPGQILPVIARGKSGVSGSFLMQWGFHLPEKKTLLINARSETASVKPLFSAALASRRCLIPAAGYYEWQREGNKPGQKFLFTPFASSPFYLAGIYQYEENVRLPVFTILTRQAPSDIAFIHSRMPVVLAGDHALSWLSPAADPQSVLQQALTLMDICRCA